MAKYEFKRKPRSYQLKALKKALSLDCLALWFDPGLGKSKVAIDFTAVHIARGDLRKILIIGPLSAVGVWEDEFLLDCPDQYMPDIFAIYGNMGKRISALKKALSPSNRHNKVVIINYDSLRNDDIMRLLKLWSPELLIVDEMHFVKNYNTIRSKKVRELRLQSKYCIGLTGTPIPKNPLDLFGQFLILKSEVFGTSYKKFRDRYAIMNYKFKSKVDSWKNLSEMASKISVYSYRVRDDECSNLPPLIIRDIPIYLEDRAKKAYNEMAEKMIVELENEEVVTAQMAATKVLKLQQITGGFIMRKDEYLDGESVKTKSVTFPIGSEKLDILSDLLERYSASHKIIIGCRFRWEIAQIESKLKSLGISFATICGGVSGETRSGIRKDFESSDGGYRVIVFQISSATAMTLIKADIGILYSSTQKWDDYWQWLKRIHRDGQNKTVYIIRLLVRGSVDEDIARSIQMKKAFTEYLVDRKSIKALFRIID